MMIRDMFADDINRKINGVIKVDHQPKGGQQTHGGQYKKNLISIAQGGQRHQREQGAHRQLYPADHGL